MYKKLVGIVVFGLLIATAMSAVGTMNEEVFPVNVGIDNNSQSLKKIHSTTMKSNPSYLFIQLPKMPWDFEPYAWTSDVSAGYRVFDDFWDISSPICDIHWWGTCQKWISPIWYNRDPTGMVVNISLYKDNNGVPGELVCYYEDVTPTITHTGIYYIFNFSSTPYPIPLYFFEYDLDPCCDLSSGWVSIQSTYVPSGGWLLWQTSPDGNKKAYHNTQGELEVDYAYMLTDREDEPVPDLECEGRLNWDKVKPGTNVTGSYQVSNNGDADSILHCKVDESSIPTWGNWTFEVNATIITVADGWVTLNVTVTAPKDKNKEFTGTLKIVNAQDSTDYCEIDVYLKTPRTRATSYVCYEWLFESFPNAFPILRQLLGLI